jgi:hypothetical protein
MTPSIIPTEQVRADEERPPKRTVDGHPLGNVTVTADPLLVHVAIGSVGQTMKPSQARELARALEWAAIETERRDLDGEGNMVLRQVASASPLRLRGKLDEMRLHENTGDPSDEGYMKAIRELDDWLASQENAGENDDSR